MQGVAIPYLRSHTGAAMAKANVEHNKLSKKLRRLVGRAVVDHSMIEEGDRVMVCLSGGKDSELGWWVVVIIQEMRLIPWP